jgi:hypothetical protein
VDILAINSGGTSSVSFTLSVVQRVVPNAPDSLKVTNVLATACVFSWRFSESAEFRSILDTIVGYRIMIARVSLYILLCVIRAS